jgi:hypothetical protein
MQDTADHLMFEVGARSVGGAAYESHPKPYLDGTVSVPGAVATVVPGATISFATLADFLAADFV